MTKNPQDPPHWKVAQYLQQTGLSDRPVDQVYQEMMSKPEKFDYALDHYYNGNFAQQMSSVDYKNLYYKKNGTPFEKIETEPVKSENNKASYPQNTPYGDIKSYELDLRQAIDVQEIYAPQSSTYVNPINLGLPQRPTEDKTRAYEDREEAFRRYKEQRAYDEVISRRKKEDGTIDTQTQEEEFVLSDMDPYRRYQMLSYQTFGESWDKQFNQIPHDYTASDGNTYKVELQPSGSDIRSVTDQNGNPIDYRQKFSTGEIDQMVKNSRIATLGEYNLKFTARKNIKDKSLLAANHLARQLKSRFGSDVMDKIIQNKAPDDVFSSPEYKELLQIEKLAENARQGQIDLIKQDEFRHVARDFEERKQAQIRKDEQDRSDDPLAKIIKAPARVIDNTLADFLSGIGEIGEGLLGDPLPQTLGAINFMKALQYPDDMLEKYNPNPSNINRDVISNTSVVEIKGKKYQVDFDDSGNEIRSFRDMDGYIVDAPDLTESEQQSILESGPSLKVNPSSFFGNGLQVVSDLLLPVGIAGKASATTRGLGLTSVLGKNAAFYGTMYAQQYHHGFEEGMKLFNNPREAHKYAGYSSAMITASSALMGIEGKISSTIGNVAKGSGARMSAISRATNILKSGIAEGTQEASENYTNGIAAYLVDGSMKRVDNLQLLNDFTMGAALGLFGGNIGRKTDTSQLNDYQRSALSKAVMNPIDYERNYIITQANKRGVPYNQEEPVSPDENSSNAALQEIKNEAQSERQFLEAVQDQYNAIKNDLPDGTDHDRVISELTDKVRIETQMGRLKAMGMEDSKAYKALESKKIKADIGISSRIGGKTSNELDDFVGEQIAYEGGQGTLTKDGNQYFIGDTRLPLEEEFEFEVVRQAQNKPETLISPIPVSPPETITQPESVPIQSTGFTINPVGNVLGFDPTSWVSGQLNKSTWFKNLSKEFSGTGPGGKLPKSIWQRNIFRKGRIDKEVDKGSFLQKSLKTSLDKAGLKYDVVAPQIRGILKSEALVNGGEILLGGKPIDPDIRADLLEIRNHADGLSKLLMNSNVTSGPMKETIDDNLGLYWTRSYQVHTDPEWVEKARGMSEMTAEEFDFYKTLLQEDIDFYEKQITKGGEDVDILKEELDQAKQDLEFAQSDPETAKKAGRLGMAATIFAKEQKLKDQKLANKQTRLEAKIQDLKSIDPNDPEIAKAETALSEITAKRKKLERQNPLLAVVSMLEGQQKKKGQSGKMTYSPSGIFKRRKRIPAAYRFAMGEFEDPAVVYAQTIYKQAFANYSWEMEEQILQAGFASGKISTTQEGTAVYPIELAGQNVYVDKETGKALDMVNSVAEHGGFSQVIYSLIGAVKMGKTVLNPVGQIRNMLSGDAFHWASGRAFYTGKPEVTGLAAYTKLMPGAVFQKPFNKIDKKQGLAESRSDQAYQAAFSPAFGYDNPEIQTLREELIANGVIGENVALNEIRDLLGGVTSKQDAQIMGQLLEQPSMAKEILEKTGISPKKVGDALKFMTTLYQASDDYHRAVAYLKSKDIYMDILGSDPFSEQWASELAAEEARDIYPTYSEIPLVLQRFRQQVPVIGPFVNFSAEVVRTQLNNYKRMRSELTAGKADIEKLQRQKENLGYQSEILTGEEKSNVESQIQDIDKKLEILNRPDVQAKIKKRGNARRWGIISYYLATTAGISTLQYALSATPFLGGADSDDFYEFLPPWTQRGSYLITHLDRDTGDYTYIDLSSIIPTAQMTYGLGKIAGVSMTEDETAEGRITEGLMSILEPITSGDLLTKSVVEAVVNSRQLGSGRKITTEEGLQSGIDRVQYILNQSKPGFMDMGGRLYKSIFDPQKDYYGSYDPLVEVSALSGIRPSTSNIADAFYFNSREIKAKIKDANFIFSREANKQKYARLNDRSLKQVLQDTYDRANTAYKDKLIKLNKQYQAAIRLGMTRKELMDKMDEAGLNNSEIRAVVSGVYPDLEIKRREK